MKKFLVLIMMLALLPAVSAMSSDYNAVVGTSGDAFVVVNLAGSGTLDLPLPLDVSSPEVTGALYVHSENGITLHVGSTEQAAVSYKTSLYTSKINDEWTFEMNFPETISKKVKISLPKSSEITKTEPSGKIEQGKTSNSVSWDLSSRVSSVSVTYKLGEETGAGISSTYIAVIVIIIVVAGAGYFLLTGKIKSTTKKKPDKGKKSILKALTDNESKIVNMLLENDGEMRRNKLERSVGIAKSSLASSLHNLERRNILEVDRTTTTHFVKFTDWFSSL